MALPTPGAHRCPSPFAVALLLVSISLPARAQTACPATAASLTAHLEAAGSAFAALDAEGFNQASTSADETLACLAEAVDPELAAAIHRNHALEAFLAQDEAAALDSFRALAEVLPGASLPAAIAPPGHPLDLALQQAAALPPSARQVLQAPRGKTLVDGQPDASLPTERSSVLQVADEHGAVFWSGYLPTGAPAPWLAGASAAPPWPDEPLQVADHSAGRALRWSAGATALAAVATYGAAWLTEAAWQDGTSTCVSGGCDADPQAELARLERLRTRANVFTVGAVGLGAASAGLGLGGLVLQW